MKIYIILIARILILVNASLDKENKVSTKTTTMSTTYPTMRPVRSYGYEVRCKLQPVTYDCDKTGRSEKKYYYDSKLEGCTEANITRCKNSLNQFQNLEDCERLCLGYRINDIHTSNANVACRLQPEFGHCHSYFPMFYFDVNVGLCKGFSFSGCGGNSNKFATKDDCFYICSNVIKMNSR